MSSIIFKLFFMSLLERYHNNIGNLFYNTAIYSLLGARVCYSKKDIYDILEEDYFKNEEKAKSFLKKLTNYKHYSVFAHSFVYIEDNKSFIRDIALTKFKVAYDINIPNVIGLSLRHFLEDAETDEIRNKLIDALNINFSAINIKNIDNVYLVYLNKDYHGYAIFYIKDISRVATHQIVRHTSLNFSQKSQRYVLEQSRKDDNLNLSNFYVPNTIKQNKELYIKYIEAITKAEQLYKEMIQNQIPAEDARYVLPNAQYSAIVISGTLTNIQDFIAKRINNDVQLETREIAQKMQLLLNSLK